MTAPLANPNVTGASAIIKAQLEAWGIGSLYNDAVKILKQGLNADAVIAQLQDTQAYKQRFWYNDVRQKAGLPVLSPADAVQTENQMRQIVRGLPAGFFTDKDIQNLIAKNVSASELADRVQVGQDKWINADADTKAWMKDHYGLNDSQAIAMILDPDKALPLVQKQLNAAAIGGAAARNGLDESTSRAEQLSTLGLTGDQATAGFGQVAATYKGDSAIAQRFGSTFTQQQAEDATFFKSADAMEQMQKLNASEGALFAGRAGTNNAGLSGGTGAR